MGWYYLCVLNINTHKTEAVIFTKLYKVRNFLPGGRIEPKTLVKEQKKWHWPLMPLGKI